MKIILDGTKMTDIKQTHKYFMNILNLPDFYGQNLDSLWDMLMEIDEDTEIELINAMNMKISLKGYSERLLELFYTAVENNTKLSFEMSE